MLTQNLSGPKVLCHGAAAPLFNSNMPLHFKRKESVRKAVKRIARRRTEKALEALQHCERLEAVHTVRKEIKQLRALLRFTREAIPASDYKCCSSDLREAARCLACARDAHVKVRALTDLAKHFKKELAQRPFKQIKHLLAEDCRRERGELSRSHAARQVERILKNFGRRADALSFRCSGWRAIGPGLRRSYCDGRRGYQHACRMAAPENFHEWRKRVKDLYYQIGLLCAIWPEQMGAVDAELDALGERLGDAHDLALLLEPKVLKGFQKCSEEEAEALTELVEKREKELQRSALLMGARFYQEKPSIFCNRLRQYWKRWRRDPRKLAQV
jgi:CHAD domain-containing protein